MTEAQAQPAVPVAVYQCMDRLCRRQYRHRAQPFQNQDGDLLGYTLAHVCPGCRSIYTEYKHHVTD